MANLGAGIEFRIEGSFMPSNDTSWSFFVQSVVERYDGDGYLDAPGNIKIRYWQIENEPNAQGWGMYANRTPESFGDFMKLTYEAIKNACPDAKVIMGGYVGDNPERDIFPEATLERMNGTGLDILDIHYFHDAFGSYRGFEQIYTYFSSLLQKHNFEDVEIWITETSTFSGTLNTGQTQTETDQARDLIRRYVFYLSLGVKKIFWTNWSHGFGNPLDKDFFDGTGLIYGVKGRDDAFYGTKKKSYYAYAIMTRILEGSDWDGTTEIDLNSKNTFCYSFQKNNRYIYVFWRQ
jgi:hypothetical protein